MEKISINLTRSDSYGLMHDSRADVRKLMQVINLLIEKHNEMVDEISALKRKVNERNG